MAQTKYLDINTFLGETSDEDVLVDDAALINTILNIVLIPKRSRKWRADSGSYLHNYLGLNVNLGNAAKIAATLLQDINKQQPYTVVRANDIVVTPMQNGAGYDLYITCQSLSTGRRSNASLQLQSRTS